MTEVLTVLRRPTRRRLRIAAVGLLVVAIVLGLAAASFGLTHRRDESAFLAYLRAYPGEVRVEEGGDVDAATAASREFTTDPAAMIAAGGRACDWLGNQRFRGVRLRLRAANQPTLTTQYLDTPGAADLGWSGYPQDTAVLTAAWAYLCPATFALHRQYRSRNTSD